jgi:hypothetical protein
MPWNEVSVMDQRREFVRLALQEGANRRELCRRFAISPTVGYKWLARWQAGDRELADLSRRPHVTPKRSGAITEAGVLAVRDDHPTWGARKIAHCLKRNGLNVPVPSTVHQILCRNGRVKPTESAPPNPGHRFEKEAPNLLWQMDFKGHMPLSNGTHCHPLTMIDDHSRYALCLKACANEQRLTVQEQLTATFQRYGLLHRQRLAVGRQLWCSLDRAQGLAAQAWRQGSACQTASPASPRQERALPSHAQGRGVRHAALPQHAGGAASPGCLAHRVQSGTASRGSWNGRPCQSLSAEFPRHARSASKDRIRQWRDRSNGLIDPMLHRLQGKDVESPSGLRRRAPCHQAPEPGRVLWNLLRQLAGCIDRLDGRPKCQ